MKGGYLKFCSCKCNNTDPNTFKKKQETSKKLYGSPNYRNSEQARKTRAKHLADGTITHQEITQSAAEIELIEQISSYYTNKIIHGDRTILDGYELDIWLPDIKVGIEYDGEYWHADPNKYKPTDIVRNNMTAKDIWDKDKRKDLLCESKGINLFRIKEYDYKHNKSEVLVNLYKYINEFI